MKSGLFFSLFVGLSLAYAQHNGTTMSSNATESELAEASSSNAKHLFRHRDPSDILTEITFTQISLIQTVPYINEGKIIKCKRHPGDKCMFLKQTYVKPTNGTNAAEKSMEEKLEKKTDEVSEDQKESVDGSLKETMQKDVTEKNENESKEQEPEVIQEQKEPVAEALKKSMENDIKDPTALSQDLHLDKHRVNSEMPNRKCKRCPFCGRSSKRFLPKKEIPEKNEKESNEHEAEVIQEQKELIAESSKKTMENDLKDPTALSQDSDLDKHRVNSEIPNRKSKRCPYNFNPPIDDSYQPKPGFHWYHGCKRFSPKRRLTEKSEKGKELVAESSKKTIEIDIKDPSALSNDSDLDKNRVGSEMPNRKCKPCPFNRYNPPIHGCSPRHFHCYQPPPGFHCYYGSKKSEGGSNEQEAGVIRDQKELVAESSKKTIEIDIKDPSTLPQDSDLDKNRVGSESKDLYSFRCRHPAHYHEYLPIHGGCPLRFHRYQPQQSFPINYEVHYHFPQPSAESFPRRD